VLTSEVIPTSASTPLRTHTDTNVESEAAPSRVSRLVPVAEASKSAVVTPNDPGQLVSEFVDRSRKEAEASIAALTKEAEELRVRLKKVESALDRWQSVSRALAAEPAISHPAVLSNEALSPVTEEVPQELEPAGELEARQ
ncbi:hypothetical protein ACYOEI_15160, partial [Singulisphaera rosea]